MGNCVGNFIHYLEKEKRYSAHTIIAYKTDIQQFADFLAGQYGITDICLAETFMVRSWLAGMMDAGMSRTSLNRKISTLKSIYRYAQRSGLIRYNPMHKVHMVRKASRLPEFVEESSLDSLFDAEQFGHDFAGVRDRLILTLLYTTGMRLAELSGLRHADIDLYNDQIRVSGKRGKQRLIPVIGETRAVLQAYIALKQAEFGGAEADMFLVTDKGRAVYPRFVYRKVQQYLSRVTSRHKKSPHVLRHSFATHMLDHGADLNAIKELLGHASLSATQVYTHNTIEKIKSIYKQAHPKA